MSLFDLFAKKKSMNGIPTIADWERQQKALASSVGDRQARELAISILEAYERGKEFERTDGDLLTVRAERDRLEAECARLRSEAAVNNHLILTGPPRSLINDLAALVPIPGSPSQTECMQWLINNLPKLREDACRWRHVASMPNAYCLAFAFGTWSCAPIEAESAAQQFKTAEEAVDALDEAPKKAAYRCDERPCCGLGCPCTYLVE